jgi:hypothetical protein
MLNTYEIPYDEMAFDLEAAREAELDRLYELEIEAAYDENDRGDELLEDERDW